MRKKYSLLLVLIMCLSLLTGCGKKKLDAFDSKIFNVENDGVIINYTVEKKKINISLKNNILGDDPRTYLEYYIDDSNGHLAGDEVTVYAKLPLELSEKYDLKSPSTKIVIPKVAGSYVSDDDLKSNIDNLVNSTIVEDILKKVKNSQFSFYVSARGFKSTVDISKLKNASMHLEDFFDGNTCTVDNDRTSSTSDDNFYTDGSITFECSANELFDIDNYILEGFNILDYEEENKKTAKISFYIPVTHNKNEAISSFLDELISNGAKCFGGVSELYAILDKTSSVYDEISFDDTVTFPYAIINDDVAKKIYDISDSFFHYDSYPNNIDEYLISPVYLISFVYDENGEVNYTIQEDGNWYWRLGTLEYPYFY